MFFLKIVLFNSRQSDFFLVNKNFFVLIIKKNINN